MFSDEGELFKFFIKSVEFVLDSVSPTHSSLPMKCRFVCGKFENLIDFPITKIKYRKFSLAYLKKQQQQQQLFILTIEEHEHCNYHSSTENRILMKRAHKT